MSQLHALDYMDNSFTIKTVYTILFQQCLDVAPNALSALPALEDQLNQLVYQAYGLEAEDIAVIESHVEGT